MNKKHRIFLALPLCLVLGSCESLKSSAFKTPPELIESVIAPDNTAFPQKDVATEGMAERVYDPATSPRGLSRGVSRLLSKGNGRAADGSYTLDITDVDIRELSDLILGEMLGENYVVEQGVTGRVSLKTPKKLSRDDLLPILETALESQGAELIRSGSLYKVTAAPGAATDIGGGQVQQRGINVTAIPLKYASATDMQRTLLPIAKDVVGVTVDTARNTIILSGRSRDISSIASLVSTLDIGALNDKSFGLYTLENAEADDVVEELRFIFPEASNVQVLSIDRMNAVLAVAPASTYLADVADWIESLDQSGGKNRRQIFVYNTISGQPERLARVLNQLLNEAEEGDGEKAEQAPAAAASTAPRTTPPAVSGFALPGNDDSSIDVFNAQQGNEAPASSTQATAEEAGKEDAGIPQTALRIIPDGRTDRIFVYATEEEWSRIRAALTKLDAPTPQVIIEATIVEVMLNDNLRYGLQYTFNEGDSVFRLRNTTPVSSTDPTGSAFSFTFDDLTGTRVVLDALSAITDVNIISSPRLMVLAEETATLQIGDQVPIATQSATPLDTDDTRVVNSIELKDTGVILNLTPHIGSGGNLIVDIEQEISDVVQTTTSGIDSPTIRQRRVSSKIALQDGQTIALAGLTRNTTNDSKSGIPIARDLPVVGPLFGSRGLSAQKSELLIMLTPRIVRDLGDARAITNELKEKLSKTLGRK